MELCIVFERDPPFLTSDRLSTVPYLLSPMPKSADCVIESCTLGMEPRRTCEELRLCRAGGRPPLLCCAGGARLPIEDVLPPRRVIASMST